MASDTTFRSPSNRTQTRGETERERDAETQKRRPVYALKLTVKTKFVADSLFPSFFPSNPRGGDLDFS